MARSIGPVVLAAVLASVSTVGAGAPPAKPKPAPSAPAATDVVATIAGEPFTAAQLEQAAGPRLFQVRTQHYPAQMQILDEEIGKRLLEREAAARKVSVDDLVKEEVEARVPPISETEQKTFYEQNKLRFGPMPEAEALKRIETGLRQQRLKDRRTDFVGTLREKAGVRVLLEPPRLAVDLADSPSRGPATAPVTIVEFSDFQCPYCSRATAVIKRVEETYPGKIRLVYRDFPLTSIHPQAARAAEAAGCANDQGKFWAMHDALFGHQDKLQDADLKQHAADSGLDAAAFAQCLESGRHTADWQRNQADGERYGISSTPAFFVNGRLIVGAQPFEAFARVIDDELARSAAAPAAAGKASSSR